MAGLRGGGRDPRRRVAGSAALPRSVATGAAPGDGLGDRADGSAPAGGDDPAGAAHGARGVGTAAHLHPLHRGQGGRGRSALPRPRGERPELAPRAPGRDAFRPRHGAGTARGDAGRVVGGRLARAPRVTVGPCIWSWSTRWWTTIWSA